MSFSRVAAFLPKRDDRMMTAPANRTARRKKMNSGV
jgi:hypothetical protein